MVEFFAKLFEYDAWANRRILDALGSAPSADAEAKSKLSHLLAAEQLWLRRLRGQDYTGFNVFPQGSLGEARAQIEDIARDWTAYFSTLSEEQIGGKIGYRDTKGGQFETIIRDVLMQLFAHGNYHRGQINLHIRQSGGKPAVTDYMAYVRK